MKTYETVEHDTKQVLDNLPHAILIAARMVCHAINKDPERADRLFWEATSCLVEGFPLEDGVIDTEKMKQWLESDDRTTPATDI